jgi:signal peptidase I
VNDLIDTVLRGAVAAIVPVAALFVLARLSLRVIRVSGPSMEPTLPAGSRVLALRCWPRWWLRPGQVVLLSGLRGTASDRLIVKRVAHVAGETAVIRSRGGSHHPSYVRLDTIHRPMRHIRLARGEIFVLGDNSSSTDSRDWGPIPVESVVGLVLSWTAVSDPRRVHP